MASDRKPVATTGLAVGLAMGLAVGLATTAGAAEVAVTLRPAVEPLMADGETVAVLVVTVSPSEGLGPRVLVTATRGKILSTGPLTDGSAEIRFRPPRLSAASTISFTVTTHVGRRRLRRKVVLPVEAAPAAAASTAAEAEAPAEPAGTAAAAAPAGTTDGGATSAASTPAGAAAPPDTGEPEAPLAHRYVLWGIDSMGVEEQMTALLGDLLRLEVQRVLGDRLIPPESVGMDIRGKVYACGGTPPCLAQAARDQGATRVITSVVGQLGEEYSLNLRLLDVASTETVRKATANLSGERGQMLPALQRLVYELIDPSLLAGSLVVQIGLDGVDVFVDGIQRGTTPLADPVGGLTPGDHALKLTSPVMRDYFTFFSVVQGKTTTVEVAPERVAALQAELAAAQEALAVPVVQRWWFWALIGGAAAVAVAAGSTVYAVTSSGGAERFPASTLGTINHAR